jgi:tetratricopeptide (TPR) repeat protein
MSRPLSPPSRVAGTVRPDRLLETHLARVLFAAREQGLTGVLTVDEGPLQTRLHLVDGAVVFAEAGPLAETLGRLLMRHGILERDEYLLILERMAEPSERDEVLRFGEVAIQLGMMSAAELGEGLALQVRSKLQRCLLLDEAAWSWRDDEAPRRGTPFPTPLEPALRTALREDPQAHRWPGLLAALRHRIVRLRGSPDALARRFGANPSELRLLERLDERPLGTVLQNGILEPRETGALLAALLFADALELGRHVSDGVEAFGAGEGGAAPKAPRRAAPRREGARPREAGAASAERAREAAERLRAEMRRRGRTPPTQRARLDAERAFERGRSLLARGAVHRAKDAFERATRLLPEAAEYALYLRWCEYLDEEDPLRKPVFEQLLRGAVLEALRQDRRMAYAHYVQGRLYLLDEDEAAALKAFAIAAKLDPGDVEIARYHRLLRARLER